MSQAPTLYGHSPSRKEKIKTGRAYREVYQGSLTIRGQKRRAAGRREDREFALGFLCGATRRGEREVKGDSLRALAVDTGKTEGEGGEGWSGEGG